MKKFSPATKKLVAFVIIAAMLCMFAPEGFLTGRDAFAASKTVTSISIKSKPSKLKYKVGNKLSTKGLKLTVKYKGGSKATISSGFTCTPTKLSKAGTQKITVKYKGKKTSFNVTVSKVVKSIKIKSKPAKLKYKTGEKLNTKGLKLTVTYTDKSTKAITSGFTCSPTKFTKTGTQKVTVKYGGKSTSFNVTVSQATTSSLPKLTNANAAKVLEKHLTMWSGLSNDYAARLDYNDHFFKQTDDIELNYYRALDYKTHKAYVNDVKKYLNVSDSRFRYDYYIEKNNKLYLGVGFKGSVSYDLNSIVVKEQKDGTYLLHIDCYGSGDDYCDTEILKVVKDGNNYKVGASDKANYEKPELYMYNANDYPGRHRLV